MKKIINYSGIPGLILIAALVFMPVSCSKDTVKDNPEADNSSQLIKISGEDAGTATKTTLEGLAAKWVATTDQVGVYCAESTGGNVNIPYTASNTAFSSAFSGDLKWGTGTHNFYAYYPYSATSGTKATAVPITLTAAQTQSAGNSSSHLSALDFMVATPVSQAPGSLGASTSVNLRYNHVFTILEFQIKGSGLLKAVKLSGSNTLAFSGGTIDITKATPATGISYTIANPTETTKEAVVTLTSAATLTATTATKVYMVINPGTQTGNCLIGLSSNGTDYLTISKAAPVGGFSRGKKYVVTIEKDQDGNFFSTVTIGTNPAQVWMAENLKTTTYRNGDLIGITTPATLNISAESSPKYQWAYAGDENNVATYGRLYTWYAATDSRSICPIGWHLPTDSEWTTLTTFVGTNPGNQLKETGTTHWNTPNTGATNSSGFTALPGGYRYLSGSFNYIGNYGYWWSSTEGTGSAWYRGMGYSYSSVNRYDNNKTYGYSVRCVRALNTYPD